MNVIGNSIEVYKNMAKSATQDSINYKKRIDKAIEQCKQDIKDIWKWEGAYTEMFEEIIDILKGSEKE